MVVGTSWLIPPIMQPYSRRWLSSLSWMPVSPGLRLMAMAMQLRRLCADLIRCESVFIFFSLSAIDQ